MSDYMRGKILITGALGYLGSVLSAYLSKNDFECIGYDTGFFRDCALCVPSNQKTIIKDLRDFTYDDLKGIDTVIHLSAISNDPFGNLSLEKIYDPVRAYSLRLAKACKEKGVKFIFASSCSVYGKGAGISDESSRTFPQTPYSLNKLQIEGDLKEISDRNFSPVILRLATVFGFSPRMRFDTVVNMMVGMALTSRKIVLNSDGKAWRPYLHILDVCRAFECSIKYNVIRNGPLILNTGDTQQNYQIIQVAQMIKEEISDSKIVFLKRGEELTKEEELIEDRKIQDGVDSRTYQVSFELIKRTFKGFRCDWTLKNGIRSMANDLKKVNLTSGQFSHINFYRLQKMNYLYNNKFISDDLRWII